MDWTLTSWMWDIFHDCQASWSLPYLNSYLSKILIQDQTIFVPFHDMWSPGDPSDDRMRMRRHCSGAFDLQDLSEPITTCWKRQLMPVSWSMLSFFFQAHLVMLEKNSRYHRESALNGAIRTYISLPTIPGWLKGANAYLHCSHTYSCGQDLSPSVLLFITLRLIINVQRSWEQWEVCLQRQNSEVKVL